MPKRTLFICLPAALIVLAAFFATNYAAHKTLIPAYGSRSWYMYTYERGGQIRESYWKHPAGPDVGEESQLAYVFHCTFGHHGLFLLTPVWLFSFWGLALWLGRTRDEKQDGAVLHNAVKWRIAALGILLVSAVVFAFYMAMNQQLRNYGGMTSALRWLFWFVPLWSLPLVTAADFLAKSRFLRGAALFFLLLSALSVAYPTWNPWSYPWPVQWLEYLRPACG